MDLEDNVVIWDYLGLMVLRDFQGLDFLEILVQKVKCSFSIFYNSLLVVSRIKTIERLRERKTILTHTGQINNF